MFPKLIFNYLEYENGSQRAHHVDHKAGMRYIPQPCSGLGKRSWTHACVGRRPDWRILKAKKGKKGRGRRKFSEDAIGVERGKKGVV
jgi:hypothetical protein